jgi:hypothetical protein
VTLDSSSPCSTILTLKLIISSTSQYPKRCSYKDCGLRSVWASGGRGKESLRAPKTLVLSETQRKVGREFSVECVAGRLELAQLQWEP